jgi:hypothetical protein
MCIHLKQKYVHYQYAIVENQSLTQYTYTNFCSVFPSVLNKCDIGERDIINHNAYHPPSGRCVGTDMALYYLVVKIFSQINISVVFTHVFKIKSFTNMSMWIITR